MISPLAHKLPYERPPVEVSQVANKAIIALPRKVKSLAIGPWLGFALMDDSFCTHSCTQL